MVGTTAVPTVTARNKEGVSHSPLYSCSDSGSLVRIAAGVDGVVLWQKVLGQKVQETSGAEERKRQTEAEQKSGRKEGIAFAGRTNHKRRFGSPFFTNPIPYFDPF